MMTVGNRREAGHPESDRSRQERASSHRCFLTREQVRRATARGRSIQWADSGPYCATVRLPHANDHTRIRS